jgi:signal transduction histidine kinase
VPALLFGVVLTQATDVPGGRAGAHLLMMFALLATIPIGRWRAWPGLAASAALLLAASAWGVTPNYGIGAFVVNAARIQERALQLATSPNLVVMIVTIVVALAPVEQGWEPLVAGPPDEGAGWIILYAAVWLRFMLMNATLQLGIERDRADAAEAARQAAAAEERSRIARELHDVVAHQMTVVVAQAQGAHALVEQDPGQVRAALNTISATTRDALVEMRRLVDVERTAPAPPPSVPLDQPLPGLSFNDLGRLATTAEKAGLEVYMELAHDLETPVSSGVALAAHRTIQEALTNAAKHAPGARVDVKTQEGADSLEVRVENGPATRPPTDIPGAGVGLVGMRERVEFFGGTLEVGPTPDGGWSVVATFPTLEAPSTSE